MKEEFYKVNKVKPISLLQSYYHSNIY